MSGLGLAAIAANSGINAFDQRTQQQEQRDREGQRFDWEQRRANADLSTLPDRTKQAQTAAQLGAAQNQAGLDMLPKQTALANIKLDTEQAAAEAAKARQPDELVAQANHAKVQSLLSQFDVDNTPRVIAQEKAKGALTDADIYVASIAKLGDLLSANDPGTVVRFMNNMNDAGVFGAKHAPVAKVGIVADKKGGDHVFVARDAQGNPVMQIRAKDMQRIIDSTKKADLKTVGEGDTLVSVKGGQATPVYTAPVSETKKNERSAAKAGPLERDVSYLVNAHGMTQEQALAHLSQAKSMSREQFILKGISDMQAMGRKPTENDIAQMGGLFDRAVGRSAPGKPASNSPAPGTMDPRIQSLIGIP